MTSPLLMLLKLVNKHSNLESLLKKEQMKEHKVMVLRKNTHNNKAFHINYFRAKRVDEAHQAKQHQTKAENLGTTRTKQKQEEKKKTAEKRTPKTKITLANQA